MTRTKICELIGIKYPIFQGGMAWVSDAQLAAAVSNAGGLGIISAMNANVDYLRKEINRCKQLTSKPFGVNIMLMSPFADEVAKVIIEENIEVVTTGAGMPSKYMKEWISHNVKVIPVVSSSVIARRVEQMGAVAVVAEGGESGGHIGEMNTMALVPQVCDSISIPVIAAGGIGDGRGLAAAFMLGASGVQCGTCFLAAEECNIHINYKNHILKASDSDTLVTGRRLGHPIRSLKSKFSREFAKMEQTAQVSDEEVMAFGSGALRKAVQEGDNEKGCFMSGQIVGLIHKIEPAATIIENMVNQAEKLMTNINR